MISSPFYRFRFDCLLSSAFDFRCLLFFLFFGCADSLRVYVSKISFFFFPDFVVSHVCIYDFFYSCIRKLNPILEAPVDSMGSGASVLIPKSEAEALASGYTQEQIIIYRVSFHLMPIPCLYLPSSPYRKWIASWGNIRMRFPFPSTWQYISTSSFSTGLY